jgi:hypothetical protein
MKAQAFLKAGVVWGLACCLLFGLNERIESATPKGRVRTKQTRPQIRDQVKIDGNNLVVPTTNYGVHGQDVTGGNAGTEWPKGSSNFYIFGAGPYIGAVLPGGRKVVSVGYNPNDGTSEFGPGTIINGETSDPNTNDPRYRVYKITPGSGPGDTDYDEWPADDGAPVDGDGKPVVVSDQDTWTVYNDANFENHSGVNEEGDQLDIEVQQRSFAFVGAGPVNDIVFLSYIFINKGTRDLTDVYMGVLVDPDLGDFADDLAGCDTTRSIGFIYNANLSDSRIKGTPGALAYDFFQGPIDAEGNELGMTSFTIFTIANDPTTDEERYNLMAGLQKDGTPRLTGPFDLPGDPTNQSNPDIDTAPGDKRFMVASGPFQMAVGDTQRIVVGIVAAAGADNFDGVRAVKISDEQAQTIFDKDFRVPAAPANPTVTVTALDNQIILTWDDISERTVDTFGRGLADYDTLDFQGYRVYKSQTPNPNDFVLATDNEGKPAQYDKADGVTNVLDTQLDPSTGFTQTVVVKIGTDSGVRHYFIDDNVINGHTYYYDVRAYDYQPVFQPRTLERTSVAPIEAVPQAPFGQDVSTAQIVGDDTTATELTAEHVLGGSDGSVTVRVIDPTKVTGDEYEVLFSAATKPIAGKAALRREETGAGPVLTKPTQEGEITWSLKNKTTGEIVASGLAQATSSSDQSSIIIDGLLVTVSGPAPGIKQIVEVQNPSGAVDPPDNVFHSRNSTSDWFIDSDTGDLSRIEGWASGVDLLDYEIRFTANGSVALDPFGAGTADPGGRYPNRVPWETWVIAGHPDAPFRIHTTFIDEDGDDTWSASRTTSFGLPGFERIYNSVYEYNEADEVTWTSPDDVEWFDEAEPRLGRVVFGDLSGNGMPATGTVVRIITNKVNTEEDVFTFKTQAPTTTQALQENEFNKIKAVPNPYIVRNALESSQFERKILFTHLPPACTIKIYTLTGDLIKTIDHNNGSSIETWDVLTDNGLPPASGVYIYRVEATGLGAKMGKLAIIMGRTILQVQ